MELNGSIALCLFITMLFIGWIGYKYLYGWKAADKVKDDEFNRWKDFAGVLFLAVTVLTGFAFSMMDNPDNKWFVLLGGISGFWSILLFILWYSRGGYWVIWWDKTPALLVIGASLFAIESSFLLIAFIIRQLH